MKFKVGTTIKATFADDLFLIIAEVHPDEPDCQAAICLTQRNYTMYADGHGGYGAFCITQKSYTRGPMATSYWRIVPNEATYTIVSENGMTDLEKIIYGVKCDTP